MAEIKDEYQWKSLTWILKHNKEIRLITWSQPCGYGRVEFKASNWKTSKIWYDFENFKTWIDRPSMSRAAVVINGKAIPRGVLRKMSADRYGKVRL